MVIIGYFKEYYIDNKFIGCKKIEYNNEKIGYEGKKNEIITESIVLDNKKKIKKGITVSTLIYPLTKWNNLIFLAK